MATETAVGKAKPTQAGAKPKRTQKSTPKRRTRAKASKAPAPRKRKLSTPAERAKILALADREGLTAQQVQKRFGVKPVTYYSWRKANKKPAPKAKRRARQSNGHVNLAGQVREAIRAQLAGMLPEIIRSEVARAMGGKRRK